MSESQKVEQAWETPSLEEIPKITAQHIVGLESSDADEVWVLAGMHHVVLHTVGRKSGKEHRVALPFWRDENGHRIVVASFGGAPKHPSWFVNLTDHDANPEVKCRVQGGLYYSIPEVLEGEEHAATWAQLVADRAWYTDYQAKTERIIPLVRLAETRPA